MSVLLHFILFSNFSTLKDAREAAKDDEKAQEGEESEDESGDEKLVKLSLEEPNKERWDCESILSTYSNLYNHPKTIKEPSKKVSASNANRSER